MHTSLIEVSGLVTGVMTPNGPCRVVDDVSFSVRKGKVLGIIGESGCGKSMTALAIMRLLPPTIGYIESGSINFDGVELLGLGASQMEAVRGNEIAMIFQEPMTALNPVFTIGDQIGEALEVHKGLRGNEKREKTIDLLKLVGIPGPDKVIFEYPHQLSGGMRQRVMIAMALSCEPKLLIADEPTTALDVTIQFQILDLIRSVKDQLGTAVLFITHDLGVIAEIADDVAVMYLGKIVEYAPVRVIFDNPLHPYTRGLMDSRLGRKSKGDPLVCIPGMVPGLTRRPKGCAFSPRCRECDDRCTQAMPELRELGQGHFVRCLKSE